ncbi:MAG: CinA family nicotinamide mononucleotide deamidase-related protein [Pirellulales bacterium]|nr:CinA family nicotinamide mononucleotide deamidase-related protein [Pirellulales bacterium]
MIAEIISIGDELTGGRSLDTNAQWLSRRLAELGVSVAYHTTVGDQLAAIVDVFHAALGRANVVVVTGGLGPTADDLTREALAATIDRPLVCNEDALDQIRCLFAQRGWKMPDQNRVQALLPQGARLIPNPHGTAPGIALDVDRNDRPAAHVYCLPGVPAEMRQMWEQTVADDLRRLGAGRRMIRTRRIKCFGAGESAIEAMLPDLVRRGRIPQVGITASKATITLAVTAEAATEDECRAAMEPTLHTIHQCLGNLVYGRDDDELQDAVVQLLRRHGKTLATVEWATDGLLIHWLRSAAGDGPEVAGGLVVSKHSAWKALFDMPDQATTVGDEPARAMAQAVRQKLGTDYGLAIGPLSPRADGPATDGAEQADFAIATPQTVHVECVPLVSHPELRKTFCAKVALNRLRLQLLAQTHPL